MLEEHPFKIAALLVGLEKPIFTSQDVFIKMVEIDHFVADTKRYPSKWKEDLEWKIGTTIKKGDGVRLQKIRTWSNRNLSKHGTNRYTLLEDDHEKAVETHSKARHIHYHAEQIGRHFAELTKLTKV